MPDTACGLLLQRVFHYVALRNLTPGDFAVVARQLRHAPARDAADILARLRDESEAKGGASVRMGF